MMLNHSQCWQAYKQTVFYLPRNLDTEGSFSIITAANPRSRGCPENINRQRNLALQRDLRRYCRRHKVEMAYLLGCAPDLSHYEISFAVSLNRREERRLAWRYRQNAVFVVEEGKLFLVPYLFPRTFAVTYLGKFAERVHFG